MLKFGYFQFYFTILLYEYNLQQLLISCNNANARLHVHSGSPESQRRHWKSIGGLNERIWRKHDHQTCGVIKKWEMSCRPSMSRGCAKYPSFNFFISYLSALYILSLRIMVYNFHHLHFIWRCSSRHPQFACYISHYCSGNTLKKLENAKTIPSFLLKKW